MSNEQFPPSFAPQNRKRTSSNNQKPIEVNKNSHIQHSKQNRKNSDDNTQQKSNVNKNTSPNTDIPPSYIPLSQRQAKPNTYTSQSSFQSTPAVKRNTPHRQNALNSPRETNISQSSSDNFNKADYNAASNKSFYDKSMNYPSDIKNSPKKKSKIKQKLLFSLITLLILVIAWPSYLFYRANSQLTSVDALSSMQATSEGTTWLIAGSDSREKSHIQDNTEGERSDSILMVHKAPNGQASMISIPRDTLADIPGYGLDKINASFSYGGPKLLVETVEGLTNTKINHYVQIGMNGVEELVDSVNGINLCLDYDVNDVNSQLVWTAGCHDSDGKTALAFARMRYADPLSDLGRADRQRQVISKLMNKVFTPSILLNPIRHIALVDAGSQSVKTDNDSGPYDLGMLALAFRKARNDNISGLPPIESMNYVLLSGVSTVLLDRNTKDAFFEKMRQGNLTPDDFQKF